MRSYASLAQLRQALGLPAASTGQDPRLALALVAGTWYVDQLLGVELVDPDDVWTEPDPEDVAASLDVVADADAALVAACIVVAVRFYKSADVPFGHSGGIGEAVAYVSRGVPEADLILVGKRQAFGIA